MDDGRAEPADGVPQRRQRRAQVDVRTLASGAAWSVPVLAFVAAAPALAALCLPCASFLSTLAYTVTETQITISWADQLCNGQPSIRFLVGTGNNGAGAVYTATGSSSITGPVNNLLTVTFPASAFTASGGSVTIKADKRAFTTATPTSLCV
ncbi:hypothetical protein SAMN06266982_1134 [Propioniciclava tarda]|nr:hypothetical protein SAMN06266982_1134 [Propioniciclava tarda]